MPTKSTPKRKPAKRRPPAARVTDPNENIGSTGAGWQEAQLEAAYWSFGLLDKYRENVAVNEHTALTFSAVWACVRYISQTIAGLGWHVFDSTPDKPGKQRVYDDVWWLLDMQASPEMSAFDFRQVLLKDALTWGNGYAEIDRDGMGRPRWLWYISPNRVCLERDAEGTLWYRIDNGVGEDPTYLSPDRMFHLKGLGPDGLVGYSVIAMARATIKLALQQQTYGETFFSRGPMPGGLLEVPGNPKKEDRDAMKESFQKTYGGSKNAGKVVVVSGGVKFSPLTMPNEDAQWLEGRKFSVTDIARWYGVPPHKIADLDRSTNNNIEQQAMEAVQDCHLPWCRRLETEADLKLYGRVNRGRRWTRLNLNTLLRGDSATQTTNLVSQVNTGLVTPDEAREHLDYNPLPEGLGEKPIVQGAMKPLEQAVNPPEPVAPAPQDGGKPAQDGATSPPPAPKPPQDRAMPPQVAATFGALLSDTYAWQMRVESDKAKRAQNKREMNPHVESYYSPEWKRNLADKLQPALAGLLLTCGGDVSRAAEFAAEFAEYHAARSVEDLLEGTWPSWTQNRAADQAAGNLRQIWGAIR